MKYTDLKNWNKLTREEKARLKKVYGLQGIKKITKTMHDTKEESLKKTKNE